jgi:hypothetical protein
MMSDEINNADDAEMARPSWPGKLKMAPRPKGWKVPPAPGHLRRYAEAMEGAWDKMREDAAKKGLKNGPPCGH